MTTLERNTDREVADAAREFTRVWGELATALVEDYGCTLACCEADALAALYTAVGRKDVGDEVIRQHAIAEGDAESHA